MLTLILVVLALVTMLFYCITIGQRIGTGMGQFLGKVILAFGTGVTFIYNHDEEVYLKGKPAWRFLTELDKARAKAGK